MDERGGSNRLGAGEAFVDLSFWRKIGVTGSDAFLWLNDLVSADIGDLVPGRARRALLLGPTGRVRAEVTVAIMGEGALLLQDPSQPRGIDDLLAPYVLSSDVMLTDRSDEFALFGFPGLVDAPDVARAAPSAPSCLGAGVDLLAPADSHDEIARTLQRKLVPVGGEVVETWRVRAGIPRFGVDGTPDDLPQECGLEDAVSFGKGCYLGQESMAKVRNLGHPRRVLVHLEGTEPASPGQSILADGEVVGEITSTAPDLGRTFVLAKVAWDARGGPFTTDPGGALTPVHSPPREAGRPDQALAK